MSDAALPAPQILRCLEILRADGADTGRRDAAHLVLVIARDQPEAFDRSSVDTVMELASAGVFRSAFLGAAAHVAPRWLHVWPRLVEIAADELERGYEAAPEAARVLELATEAGIPVSLAHLRSIVRHATPHGHESVSEYERAFVAVARQKPGEAIDLLVELLGDRDPYEQRDGARGIEWLAGSDVLGVDLVLVAAAGCLAALARQRPGDQNGPSRGAIQRALRAALVRAPSRVLTLLFEAANEAPYDEEKFIGALRYARLEEGDGEWFPLVLSVLADRQRHDSLRREVADAVETVVQSAPTKAGAHAEAIVAAFVSCWRELDERARVTRTDTTFLSTVTTRLKTMLTTAVAARGPEGLQILLCSLAAEHGSHVWHELLPLAGAVSARIAGGLNQTLPLIAACLNDAEKSAEWPAAIEACALIVEIEPTGLPGDLLERLALLTDQPHADWVWRWLASVFERSTVPSAVAVRVASALADVLEHVAVLRRTTVAAGALADALADLGSGHSPARADAVRGLSAGVLSRNSSNARDVFRHAVYLPIWHHQLAPDLLPAFMRAALMHGPGIAEYGARSFRPWAALVGQLSGGALVGLSRPLGDLAVERGGTADLMRFGSMLQGAGDYPGSSALFQRVANQPGTQEPRAALALALSACLDTEDALARGQTNDVFGTWRQAYSQCALAKRLAEDVKRTTRRIDPGHESAVELQLQAARLREWLDFREQWREILEGTVTGAGVIALRTRLRRLESWTTDDGDVELWEGVGCLLSAAEHALDWDAAVSGADDKAPHQSRAVARNIATAGKSHRPGRPGVAAWADRYAALGQAWNAAESTLDLDAFFREMAVLPLPVPRLEEFAVARWHFARRHTDEPPHARAGRRRTRTARAIRATAFLNGAPARGVWRLVPNVIYDVAVELRVPAGLSGPLTLSAVSTTPESLYQCTLLAAPLAGRSNVTVSGTLLVRATHAPGAVPIRIRLAASTTPTGSDLFLVGDDELQLLGVSADSPPEPPHWASGLLAPSADEIRAHGYGPWRRFRLGLSGENRQPFEVRIDDRTVRVGGTIATRLMVLIRGAFESNGGWMEIGRRDGHGGLADHCAFAAGWDQALSRTRAALAPAVGGSARPLVAQANRKVRLAVHPFYLDWDEEGLLQIGSLELQKEVKLAAEPRARWAEARRANRGSE